MELHEYTVSDLSHLLHENKVSSEEITRHFLGRIDAGKNLNAFISVFHEQALESARKADSDRKNGSVKSPLHGLPIAIKDNITIEGERCTCGSRMLKDFIPPYNAHVIERLNDAGVIYLGKTNMDEFAMGSSTETSHFGPVLNPVDTSRIPGGSSGGSAASVAGALAPWSLGSDTGGSIRQPAACCGVVGVKPTYGTVSRYGLVAFASSLDQIGPFARTVEDAALLLNVIQGHDHRDSTSYDKALPDTTAQLENSLRGKKIGIPKEYFIDGIHTDVAGNVQSAIDVLQSCGAEIVDISLPHTEYAVAVYYIIAPSEASSNLARYDGVKYGFRHSQAGDLQSMYRKTRREGFGAEVKRRIMIGAYALSSGYYDAYYKKAQQVRTLIKQDFDAAFKKVDVICTPTAPTPAFKIGEKINDPLQMYLSDIFTISVNIAGLPALSMPCGLTGEGLPVGLQIIAPALGEQRMFNVAHQYEKARG